MSSRPPFVNTSQPHGIPVRHTRAEAHAADASDTTAKRKRKGKGGSVPPSPVAAAGAMLHVTGPTFPAEVAAPVAETAVVMPQPKKGKKKAQQAQQAQQAASPAVVAGPSYAAVAASTPVKAKSRRSPSKAATTAPAGPPAAAFYSDARYAASPAPTALPVPKFGERKSSESASVSTSPPPPGATAFAALVKMASASSSPPQYAAPPMVAAPLPAAPSPAYLSLLDKLHAGAAQPAPMPYGHYIAPPPYDPAMAERNLRQMLNVQQ